MNKRGQCPPDTQVTYTYEITVTVTTFISPEKAQSRPTLCIEMGCGYHAPPLCKKLLDIDVY